MCGIVGLFLKDRALEPELGSLLAGMLGTMRDRGPDSAGFAVYGAAAPGAIKLTVRGPRDCDFAALVRRLEAGRTPLPHVVYDTHLVLTVRSADEAAILIVVAVVVARGGAVGQGQDRRSATAAGGQSGITKRAASTAATLRTSRDGTAQQPRPARRTARDGVPAGAGGVRAGGA